MASTTTEGNHKGLHWIAVIAVAGLALVCFATVMKENTAAVVSLDGQRNVLTSTGTHVLEVVPDQAVILLDVNTNSSTAKEASDQNRILLNQVMASLRAQGIAESDIETTNVYLNKASRWDSKSQEYVELGYEQRTTLKVTVKDLAKAGTVLDAAISAGANGVQDISFELQPATENRYKQQALTDATKVATQKARILADAADTELGRVTSVSENSYNYVPWVYNAKQIEADAAITPTPINPQKVSISVSVTVSYELE